MYSDFAAKRQNSTYFRDLERQALAAILPSITFNFLNVAAQNTFVLESGTIGCFSTIFLPFNNTSGSCLQVIEQTWNYSSTLIRETMRLVGYLYTSNMSLKPFQFLHLIENLDLFESLSKNYWYLVFGDWYLESVHLSKKYSGTSSLSERNLSQSCSTSSFLLVRTCSKW